MKTTLHTVILSVLVATGSYAQVQNNGNLRIHASGQLGLFGDFTNNGSFTNNLGTITAAGTNAQTFDGTAVIQANNFTMNKASNTVQLDNELQVSGTFTFTSGVLLSDHADNASEFVHFLDGSTHTGASNSSHIDGVIRKTGDDAFTFPTGDNNLLRSPAISAPANATDHFTAHYSATDPDGLYSRSALDGVLDHVSACEFWILDRTGGSSDVEVSLSWASNSCGVTNLCDLEVARWDGSQWTTEGNGGTTGTTTAGTLVSGASCTTPSAVTNFSPFTLGSTSSENPLPVGMLNFDAHVVERTVHLTWTTVTEIENEYFLVERSRDALEWGFVSQIPGAGNSTTEINYADIDEHPYMGTSYYRLRMVDFNGNSTFSDVRAVNLNSLDNTELIAYPNPTRGIVTITGTAENLKQARIIDVLGQELNNEISVLGSNDNLIILDLSTLSTGTYYVLTGNTTTKISKL